MKFENTEIFNIGGAIRGMRNPYNSHDKSDTIRNKIGEEDLKLARKLISAGAEHRKFLRQIFVAVDITAPIFWWGQFDTYKIGITANSQSKMHTIMKRELNVNDFEYLDANTTIDLNLMLKYINERIRLYNSKESSEEEKEKSFYTVNYLLPQSYLQKRTVTMNFENLLNIYKQRNGHRLTQWRKFRKWAESIEEFKLLCLGERDETN